MIISMDFNGISKNLDAFHLSADEAGIIERASSIAPGNIKKDSKVQAIKMAVSMIDLSTLDGKIPNVKFMHYAKKQLGRLRVISLSHLFLLSACFII